MYFIRILRQTAVAFVIAVLPALASAGDCPVTRRPDHPFVPPFPYWNQARSDSFYYGSPALWVSLSDAGTWHGFNRRSPYVEKIFWWRQGYDWRNEPKPRLVVYGRRLDGPETFVDRDPTTAFSRPRTAMLTGVVIPAAGCWEITGEYGQDKLSFVLLVKPWD